jgi:hypothetical protein
MLTYIIGISNISIFTPFPFPQDHLLVYFTRTRDEVPSLNL